MKRRGLHPFIRVGSLETSATMVVDLSCLSSWIQEALSVEQHTVVRAPLPLLMVRGRQIQREGGGIRSVEASLASNIELTGKLERLSMLNPPTLELQISGS